jgi:hypothetical protein
VKFPTKVELINIKANDGEREIPGGSLISIFGDKQLGHDLALGLMRLEQTTMHLPDSLHDLRLKLDAELVGDPQSRKYIKRQRDGE